MRLSRARLPVPPQISSCLCASACSPGGWACSCPPRPHAKPPHGAWHPEALHGSWPYCFVISVVIIICNCDCLMMTPVMEMSHRGWNIATDMSTPPRHTHPTPQSQLRPTWHTPAALGMPGWVGGVCHRHVGRAGCQSHWAGTRSQPLAALSHLSVTVGGGGRMMFSTPGRVG